MKRASFLFVTVLLLVGLGMPAQAHDKYAYKTKGNSASFSSWQYDECGYAGLSVWAFEERTNGNKSSYNAAYVDFYRYDFCSGESEYGFAQLDGVGYSQQKLNSATVQGAGTMELVTCNYNGMGGMFPPPTEQDAGVADGGSSMDEGDSPEDPCSYVSTGVELDITWTGDGDTYKDRSNYSYTSPYSRYRYRSSGQSRDASVSGSLTVAGGAIDLSSGYGSLAQTSSGSFEVYR